MTKNLLKSFLWGIMTLSTLSSCRTEDNLNQQKQEKDMRFAVFVPQSGKTVNYADGFAHLMKRYDSIHKTNLSGMNNAPAIIHLNASTDKNNLSSQSGETFVAFNIRSQTVTEENGNKWVVFPEVTNGKIANLVVGFLSEKETKVHYYLASKESELYKNNISLFQSSLERYMKRINKLNLNASLNPVSYVKETQIEEVIITVPKKNLDPRESFGGINPAYNTGRGSCSDYGGCINDYYATGGGGGGGSSSQSASQWAKDHIDASALKNNKCADEVYQKLKDNSAFFNNLLGKFEGNSIVDLKFDIQDIGFTANTDILNVKKGYITIVLNPNYLGSTELGRASVMIHEMLHAYMTWQLINSGWNGENTVESYKSINEKNLPSLLKAYKEKMYLRPGDSEHEFISNFYIPKIVSALKAYDPNLGTDSEYEKVAWSGLMGTDTYKDMQIKDPDRAATISAIISDNVKKESCGN
ncbi:hypothetical protein CMT75_12330 [Elizabethkingia anophelis]|uniref:hypothetical protein n=1 Tax=Elizabethkingia anophelis TaxID=1117645 RepID=UPI0004043472|nr:hypothetical protein [Elizabethkingia anophelis]MCT3746179.1 hypothetical protein [Elizabethkingia anophelis]MCT4306013.1 hypothetical protein [Elizabethkingia anophelis]MDC8027410.1 hypothetical protein [Elizabethkingia anophelis]MDV3491497.1 hypothetical protein [Elizabethkingia anophelis]MDV3540988.1 hypothetical protein [Elizabethkingia anophelis]